MTDDNVTNMLDIPPERVLAGASNRKLRRVIVIGLTEDGSEYLAASSGDAAIVLWDMERARHRLMKLADEN